MCKVPGAGDSTAGLSNPSCSVWLESGECQEGGPEAGEGLGVPGSGP